MKMEIYNEKLIKLLFRILFKVMNIEKSIEMIF